MGLLGFDELTEEVIKTTKQKIANLPHLCNDNLILEIDTNLRFIYKFIAFKYDSLYSVSMPICQSIQRYEEEDKDYVPYSRFPSEVTYSLEYRLLVNRGLDNEKSSLIVCNSGISALLLILMLLKHEIIEAKDLVLYNSSIYNECKELIIQELPCRVEMFEYCSNDEKIVKQCLARKPKVIFIDIIGHHDGFTFNNVCYIINELKVRYKQRLIVVIDNTLTPFYLNNDIIEEHQYIEVISYESLSKLHQYGLDLFLSGCIVSPMKWYHFFNKYRTQTGTSISKAILNTFPVVPKHSILALAKLMKNNVALFICNIQEVTQLYFSISLSEIENYFIADKVNWNCGLIYFSPKEEPFWLNQSKAFIINLIQNCRQENIYIDEGVGFGFIVPRITSVYENNNSNSKFLFFRLWIGLLSEEQVIAFSNIFNQTLKEIEKNA